MRLFDRTLTSSSSNREPCGSLTAIAAKMTSLKAVTALRGIERTQISNIYSKIRAIREKGNDRPDRTTLSLWVTKLRARLAKMQEYDAAILSEMTDEEIATETTLIAQYSETALESIGIVEDWMSERPRSSPGIREASPVDRSETSTAASTSAAPSVTVMPAPPQLDTTPDPFTGDRLRYRVFRNQFDNWIARRTQASELDKLVALTRLLRSDAKSLVESLPWLPTSYEVALTLLDENYGGLDYERDQRMGELMTIAKVKTAEDLNGLRLIVNKVNTSIQILESLGSKLEGYSTSLWPVLCSAVPSELYFDHSERQAMATEHASGATNVPGSTVEETTSTKIRALIKYLTRYIKHKEQSRLQRQDPQRRPQNQPGPRSAPKATAAAAAVTGRKPKPCLFCNSESHRTYRCSSDQTVDLKQWKSTTSAH